MEFHISRTKAAFQWKKKYKFSNRLHTFSKHAIYWNFTSANVAQIKWYRKCKQLLGSHFAFHIKIRFVYSLCNQVNPIGVRLEQMKTPKSRQYALAIHPATNSRFPKPFTKRVSFECERLLVKNMKCSFQIQFKKLFAAI